MFKVKQKIRSILLACLTTLFAFVLALGVFSVMPKVTVNAAEPTTASKTIKELIAQYGWTTSTTKQTFKLDNNVTVKVNGGSNTGKAYDDEHIRIYATDTPAGTLTISVPDGYELVSVKVSANTGTYAFLYVDGTTKDICNITTAVSGSSVVLNSVKNGSNGKQVQVTAIEVVYKANETPACDHANATEDITKAATCTEAGNKTIDCNDCDYVGEVEIPATGHSYGEPQETEAPTCTTAGEKTSTCTICDDVKTEAIPATGHNYVDGSCNNEGCGAKEPNEGTATLSFADKENRTSFSTTKQVWEQNGITFTNNKVSTSDNVADYAAPVRLYKGSELVVECTKGKINKIVFDANSTTYATALKNSITGNGVTISVSSDKVTVEFAEPVDSFTITLSGGQVRLDSIEVTFIPSECNHENATVTETPATCTEPGSKTTTCECGYENIKELPATGHVNQTKTTVNANCTETGSITVTCDDCNAIVSTTVIPASHSYVDGACSVCQAKQPVKATLTFDNKGKRTEYSTEKQVWQENGITITNNKAKSSTAIGDYAPIRFYKDSEIVVAYSGLNIKKIEFTCTNTDYASKLQASIGETATANDKIVTVTLDNATSEYTFEHTETVVYVDSITVYTVQGVLNELQGALNEVQAYMQLSYQYNTDTNENGAVVLKGSAFRLRFAVDASLFNIEGADEYGILITDETGKSKPYNLNDDSFVMTDAEGKYYVVIDLGDTDNNLDRLSLEFTVCAYVKVDGEEEPICSEQIKTHSVVSMVNDYYLGNNVAEAKKEEVRAMVEHLYNYLVEKGLIEKEVA